MLQKKPTKKQARKIRRTKFALLLLILIFLGICVFLAYRIWSFKKPAFISPVSNLGFYQNTAFENKLKEKGIDWENLKFENNIYQFRVKEQGRVSISTKKNIDEQISSLQLILRRLKIEGRRFKSLDFRYDKPVIIF